MPAPQSVNEDLFDASVRHKVNLLRLANGTVRKILAVLNKTDLDLVQQIQKLDLNDVGDGFKKRRLEALLKAVREISADAYRQVNNQLGGQLAGLAKYEAGFQANLLASTIPVVMDIVTPAAPLLSALATKEPISGRLLKEWTDSLSANNYARVSQAIRLGMAEGQTTPQMIQRIRGTRALKFKDGILEISRRSAEALVRTAVADVSHSARDLVYKQNADIISKIQWVSTLDTRTCPRCAALDGKTYDMGEGPRPPLHINCRCTTVPITKSYRELGVDLDEVPAGTRASMNGQVPATQTYESWLRKQSADTQDDVLGVTKGALFRRGGLKIRDFVNNAGKEYTLDELRKVEAGAFKKANIAA